MVTQSSQWTDRERVLMQQFINRLKATQQIEAETDAQAGIEYRFSREEIINFYERALKT